MTGAIKRSLYKPTLKYTSTLLTVQDLSYAINICFIYHVVYSLVSQSDSSSKSCSKLTWLVTRSFSLAVICAWFGISLELVLDFRLIITDEFAAVIFLLLAECKNPFGVCRKCLANWWAGLPSLEIAFWLVFKFPWSAVSVEMKITQSHDYILLHSSGA